MWQPLSSLIPSSIRKAGIEKPVSDALVCDSFNLVIKRLIGELADHCKAMYIKDGVLWVAVLSSSVSSELSLYERDIIQSLASEFGDKRVRALRFIQ